MKIRRSLLWFTAILAMLIVMLIWFGHKKPTAKPLGASAENISTLPTTTAPSELGVNAPVRTNASVAGLVTATTTPKQPMESQEHRMMEALSGNHVPIVFYGKIEDQLGNPLATAKVNFGVRIKNGYESTVKYGQAISDVRGLFTISGYKGESLGIGVEKAGYVFVSMNGSGIYSKFWPEDQRAHPDPNNPTIIKMWKLQGGEALIHFSIKARVPHDGTPLAFDLRNGKTVNSGGDLSIRLESPLVPSPNPPYDWRAGIQMTDGGIVVSQDAGLEKMFQAPDSGYNSEFNMNYQRDVRPWVSSFHGSFYFKIKNSFGKLDLGIVIPATKDGMVPITIDGYINPSDSRDLEIDPKQVTEAHP